MNDKKRDRFVRVAEKRVNDVLHALRALGNCAAKESYEYSEKDVEKILNAIDREVNVLRDQFAGLNRFTLSSNRAKAVAEENSSKNAIKQSLEAGRQAEVTNDFIEELAFKLDRFAENFDTYEYMDQVNDSQALIQEIKADLAAGNTASYRVFLDTVIAEASDETAVEDAKVLKGQLDKLKEGRKTPLVDQITSASKRTGNTVSDTNKEKDMEI